VDTPMKQIGFGKNDGMQSGRTVESGVWMVVRAWNSLYS
jgi:hypothetical protein